MMFIENAFNIGDTVYLKTDPEQLERTVTAIRVSPGALLYYLSCGVSDSGHYGFEIAAQKDVNKALNIEND